MRNWMRYDHMHMRLFAVALCALAIVGTEVHAQTKPSLNVDVSGALKTRGINVPKGTLGTKKDAQTLGLTCPIGDPVAILLGKREGIPEYEIQRMGPAFACNLARFIDAGEKAGAAMKIYSGARNFRQPGAGANCQRVPCSPSTHELGCAADLTFNGARQVEGPQCPGNSACVWAHQNANTFGLQFRLMPQNGFNKPEPWHIELAGARGPQSVGQHGYCPDSAGTPTPPGGLGSPSGPGSQEQGRPQSSSPSALPPGLKEALQKFLNPPPPPPPRPLENTQQLSQYLNPPETPTSSPETHSATTSSSTVYLRFEPKDETPTRPAYEQILEIAVQEKPTEPEVPILTPLVENLFTPMPLMAERPVSNSGSVSPPALQGAPLGSVQTFTSKDLKNSGADLKAPARANPYLLNVLESLRHTTIALLEWLRPFRGRVPSQAPAVSTELLE